MWRLPGALRACTTTAAGTGIAQYAARARCEDKGKAEEDFFGLDDAAMNFDDPSSSSGSALESATLKPPGQLEQWSAAMQALTTVATFKGAKVDQSKPLTPNFVVRHAVQLGCEARDPAESAQYSFMGQVFNDTGVLMSTLDWNGTLEAQAIMPAMPFNKGMASKFILYLSGQNDMFWHDVEYAGGTSNWQFRWGNNVMGWQGPMAHLAYTQAVTSRLSLGAEAGLANGGATPTYTSSFKYERPADAWVGLIKSHCQPSQPAEPSAQEVSLHYHRKVVKDRVNLAASLVTIPAMMHAQAAFGAEFQLHQSTVQTSVMPGAGKLATVVSAKLSPGLSMSLSADAALGQADPQTGAQSDAFKFGYGLSLGS